MDNFDLKILCIDDEQAILDLYGQAVTAAGLTPILCTSPLDAEQRFREEIPNIALVISDLQMPEKSGFEFRTAILPEALAVPFIIVSAYITKEMALEALDLKIDGFFDKPINDDDFQGIIKKYAGPRIDSIRESQMIEEVFIEEASAIVEEMESVLLALDHDRSNDEQLNLIFRCAHTIKGSSGVLSSDIVTRYVHSYEDIISSLKKKELEFTDFVYEILIKGFDRIKELIGSAATKSLQSYRLEDLMTDLKLDSKPPAAHASDDVVTGPQQSKSGQKAKDNISVPVEILEKLSGCSG